MITTVNQVLLSRDGRNAWNCWTNARWWAAVLEWFTEQRSQAPFLRRKAVLSKRVTLLSELLLASQRFLHFHIKLGEPFKEKTKSWLDYRADLPSWVTLLARQTFLHLNTLARLAGSTRPRWDDQSMRENCSWKASTWIGPKGQLLSHINAC